MKKSNQSLNKAIARKDLINSISVLSAVLIIVFGILIFLSVLSPEQDKIAGKTTYFIEQYLHASDEPSMYHFCCEHENVFLFTTIGGLALGVSQFEFLHRRKYASILFSFGIKRETLLLNRLIIPLVLALFCIILPYAISLKLNIEVFGFRADMFPWFFFELIRVIRVFFCAYTISVIACIFTGRTIEAIAGSVSIAALPTVLFSLFDILFNLVLFGYSGTFYSQTADVLAMADPIFFSSLMFSRGYETSYPVSTPLDSNAIIQAVFSIAWIILSIVAITLITRYFSKSYKPESTGFKGINKYMVMLISFTAPLFIATFIMDYLEGYFSPTISGSIKALTICASLAVGFVASLICGFIVHFTFKKIKSSVIGGLAVVMTICIGIVLGATGLFGAYHNTPKAEEIEKIEVEAPFQEFFPDINENFSDFTQQYLYDKDTALVISEKEDIETILNLHKIVSESTGNAVTSCFTLTYILKDGSTITRNYAYPDEESSKVLLKLWDTKAAKELYKNFFFPKTDSAENLDYAIKVLRHENPYIMDYNDEDAYINITTRDLETKSVLGEITEAEFDKLKKAIYKDICNLSSSEWFTPEEEQLGAITFSYASYQRFSYESHGAKFYITPNMTNTVKALKELDLYRHFECKKEIQKVLVADIKEYVSWENSTLANNKKDAIVHEPHFTYMDNGWSHVCIDSYDNGDYMPPVKEITDKMQIKSLTEKGYIAYNIFNNGKIIFVKYSDDTYSSYVIPYEK